MWQIKINAEQRNVLTTDNDINSFTANNKNNFPSQHRPYITSIRLRVNVMRRYLKTARGDQLNAGETGLLLIFGDDVPGWLSVLSCESGLQHLITSPKALLNCGLSKP